MSLTSKSIVTPLTYIINVSLTSAEVSDDFKIARAVPLYKKGNYNYEGNYRPVSILSVASKLLQRITYSQVSRYFKQHKVLYKFQSGFRDSFSTDTALTYIVDAIRFNMDKGHFTGVVLLDVQKAFDMVNHDILLCKLKSIGFDSAAFNGFRSYLTSRSQVVDINNNLSQRLDIDCGVSQGYILGPLLFLLYVNDMQMATSCNVF